MTILEGLPHTVDIQRRVRTRANVGHRDDFVTVAANVSCWVQEADDREIREFAGRGMSITNAFYFTTQPDTNERDILIFNGNAYEVVSTADPDATAGMGLVYRVFGNLRTTGSSGT